MSTIHSLQISPGGVPKLPVDAARVSEGGVEGDKQKQLRFHGGPDKALCLYSLELIEQLQGEGHPIVPGSTGENLTLSGVAWSQLGPGSQLVLGGGSERVVIEVTDYATPCNTIGGSFLEQHFLRISQKHQPGWSRLYAKVIEGGLLRAGDPVEVR